MRAVLLALALCVALAIAACGSADNGGVMDQSSTTKTPAPGRY